MSFDKNLIKIDNQSLELLNKDGYFNIGGDAEFVKFSDAQPTFTQQNIGMPAGILSSLNNKAIYNILNARNADKILGKREKLLDWADQDYYIPLIERTGQTTPYSDNAMPIFAGMNINFDRVGHYRFTCAYRYENLKAAQVSKAKLDYASIVTSAVTEAMAVELNRTAFNGYLENSGNSFLCYGLLNNPNLANYENSAKTFATMTWQEIMAFFAGAVGKLVEQSGQNITADSKIRVAISYKAYTTLISVRTDLGISVYQEILNTYRGMEFIPAIELDNANNNQNVIYFIGEDVAGGVDDTTMLGYSELALMSNTQLEYFGYSQAMAAGTCGSLVFKPLFIVRYTNI
ncbi:TPA: hypothetical protein RTG66_001549 [Campylobacter jejuni]|nr:hypothetical protein [Campylobacter jejuni]